MWVPCMMFHAPLYPIEALTNDSSHESTISLVSPKTRKKKKLLRSWGSFHYFHTNLKRFLHVKSALSLFLSHLNIHEKYNLSSQPLTRSITWAVPCAWCKKIFINFFIAFSLLCLLHIVMPCKKTVDTLMRKLRGRGISDQIIRKFLSISSLLSHICLYCL